MQYLYATWQTSCQFMSREHPQSVGSPRRNQDAGTERGEAHMPGAQRNSVTMVTPGQRAAQRPLYNTISACEPPRKVARTLSPSLLKVNLPLTAPPPHSHSVGRARLHLSPDNPAAGALAPLRLRSDISFRSVSDLCGVWDYASRFRLRLLLFRLLLAEHLVARILHRDFTSLDGGGARLVRS